MKTPEFDHSETRGKIKLPLSSRSEDLETISRNRLTLLFEPRYFEVKPENYRDKGVDFTIELKENSAYTNFRIAVQLKSTESVKLNNDNSISYPIEVSNINYLCNYPMPAYYILYDHRHDHFYYEEAIQVREALTNKYKNGQYPDSFKFRFDKILTKDAIPDIYQKGLKKGNLLSALTPHINSSLTNPAGPTGIVIDQDNKVSTIEENIKAIERYGLDLLNQAEFGTIIDMEQRSYPRKTVSPLFNLICGIAYLYKGNSHKALDFLRLADNKASQLEPLLQPMLNYTLLHAKHFVGILDIAAFNLGTQTVFEDADLGSFLELQKARKIMREGDKPPSEKLRDFYINVQSIIKKEPGDPKTRGMAYTMLLEAESNFLINDLNRNLFFAIGSGKPFLKAKIYETWDLLERQYYKRLDELMNYLADTKNFLPSTTLGRIRIEWNYRKAYMSHFFDNWSFRSFQSKGVVNASAKQKLLHDCGFLDCVSDLFKGHDRDEAIVQFLILKYKILMFLEENQLATSLKDDIYNIIEENDNQVLKKEFDSLNSGTFPHQLYRYDASEKLKHIYRIAEKQGIEKYLIAEDFNVKENYNDIEISWTVEEFMPLDIPASV